MRSVSLEKASLGRHKRVLYGLSGEKSALSVLGDVPTKTGEVSDGGKCSLLQAARPTHPPTTPAGPPEPGASPEYAGGAGAAGGPRSSGGSGTPRRAGPPGGLRGRPRGVRGRRECRRRRRGERPHKTSTATATAPCRRRHWAANAASAAVWRHTGSAH